MAKENRNFLENIYRKVFRSDQFGAGVSLIGIRSIAINEKDNQYSATSKVEGAKLVADRHGLWRAFSEEAKLKAIDFGNGIVLPRPGREEGEIWTFEQVLGYMKLKHGWEWKQFK